MKKILIIAISLFITSVEAAESCTCMPASPQQNFESANTVFSGRVIHIKTRRKFRLFRSSLQQKIVIFQVDQVWKGQEIPQLTVITSNSSASCGVNFVQRESYLVYASGSDDELTTSLCSGTKPLIQAQSDIWMLDSWILGTGQRQSNNLVFQTLGKQLVSEISDPFEIVIIERQEWNLFWSRLPLNYMPNALDDFNFMTNMIIGVGLGNKPSAGYSVEIQDILMEDDKLIVNAVELQPGQNCSPVAVTTQPYHLVTVERSDLPVEFNRKTEIVNCY